VQRSYGLIAAILLSALVTAMPAVAQAPDRHQHHQHPPPAQKPEAQPDHGEHDHAEHPPEHQHPEPQQPEHHHPEPHPPEHHAHPEAAAHAAPSSGTALLPAFAPAHMWMREVGNWHIMAHGNVFLTYNRQGGPRGDHGLESMNWAMLMQERRLGAGRLQLRQMFSLEPWTQRRGGFPQIFQAGETFGGEFLVDRQHPHDLFGELAAHFSVPINERASWYAYGGAVGEPALGPVAFMHRTSGLELPAAPLSHHLQDSTHIAFGVITSGFHLGPFTIEGSVFNGREPDEVRYDFDFGPLDSWSVRAALRPSPHWALQYSYGYLTEPEAHEPGDINRQTASAIYHRPLASGYWATAFVYGTNFVQHDQNRQHSFLVESTVNFQTRNYAYTRIEVLDRDELFAHQPGPHLHDLRIGAYTFGGVRDLVHSPQLQVGLGADVTFYSKPAELDPIYGRNPVSFRVFLRLRPGLGRH
jgi:hypothetical protein